MLYNSAGREPVVYKQKIAWSRLGSRTRPAPASPTGTVSTTIILGDLFMNENLQLTWIFVT